MNVYKMNYFMDLKPNYFKYFRRFRLNSHDELQFKVGTPTEFILFVEKLAVIYGETDEACEAIYRAFEAISEGRTQKEIGSLIVSMECMSKEFEREYGDYIWRHTNYEVFSPNHKKIAKRNDMKYYILTECQKFVEQEHKIEEEAQKAKLEKQSDMKNCFKYLQKDFIETGRVYANAPKEFCELIYELHKRVKDKSLAYNAIYFAFKAQSEGTLYDKCEAFEHKRKMYDKKRERERYREKLERERYDAEQETGIAHECDYNCEGCDECDPFRPLDEVDLVEYNEQEHEMYHMLHAFELKGIIE